MNDYEIYLKIIKFSCQIFFYEYDIIFKFYNSLSRHSEIAGRALKEIPKWQRFVKYVVKNLWLDTMSVMPITKPKNDGTPIFKK